SDPTASLSVALEDGPFLSGRVLVASTGEPLRDMEVRLIGRSVGSQSVPAGWAAGLDALASEGGLPLAVTRTNSSGEFRFRGLLPMTYVLVSGSPSWFLQS